MTGGARVFAAAAAGLLVAGAAAAEDAGAPLSACAGAVGTYLTTNPGPNPSRSLVTFSADGLVGFADSGEGGGAGFPSFTGGHGAWRCLPDAGGALALSATILDFSLASVDWPEQRIGRLDIAAAVDAATGTMTGTMKLMTVPLAGDPLAPGLEEVAGGSFSAARVTAP